MSVRGNKSVNKVRERRTITNEEVNTSTYIYKRRRPVSSNRVNLSAIENTNFKIRPLPGKLPNAKSTSLKNIFENFDDFVKEMIDKEIEINSESDLYLQLLSRYLNESLFDVALSTKLKLIADTTNQTLQPFGEALKNLRELCLDNSVIASILDVGTSFRNLRILKIERVGLKELTGLAMFPSLEEFYAPYNYVQDLSNIEFLENLQILDMEANYIADIDQLSYIPENVTEVNFNNNKITEDLNYMKILLKYAPQLKIVDNMGVKIDMTATFSVLPISLPNDVEVNVTKTLDTRNYPSSGMIKSFKNEKTGNYFQNVPLAFEMQKRSIKYEDNKQLVICTNI